MAELYLDPASYARVKTQLTQLAKIEESETVNQALKEGAKIIANQAKSLISVRLKKKTGNLVSSPAVMVKKKTGRAYAGYRRPEGSHAHILDKGTINRKTRKGYDRGRIQAVNFHEDAISMKQSQVTNTIVDSIEMSIRKIIERNNG